MKKKFIVLTLALCGVFIFSSLALAEEEEEEILVELKEGNIEFELDLFSYETITDQEDELITDGDLALLNFAEGHHNLWVGLEGTAFSNNFDWNLDFVRDPNDDLDTDLDDGVTFAMLHEIEAGELELSSNVDFGANQLWSSLTNDATLRAKKAIDNLEGQAVVNLNNNLTPVQDEQTYIAYNLLEDLTLTAKPYQLNFDLGDEFNVNEDVGPGLKTEYILGDLEFIAGLNTTGNKDFNEVEDSTDFDGDLQPGTAIEGDGERYEKEREINNLGIAKYNLDDNSFLQLGYILELNSSSEFAEIDGHLLGDDTTDADHEKTIKQSTPSFMINLLAENKLSDSLTVNVESRFDYEKTGGVTNETITNVDDDNAATDEDEIEKDPLTTTTNLGFHAGLENEFDFTTLALAYTLNREKEVQDQDYDDGEYLDTITTTTLGHDLVLGSTTPLEDNLNLIADLNLGLESSETEVDEDAEDGITTTQGDSEFTFGIQAKLQYKF